jgi:hypothetical protein
MLALFRGGYAMPVFANSEELRDMFGGFEREVVKHELVGFSGTGLVLAYTVFDPAARFVLDAREPATPGCAYKMFIDDHNAPEATVDILLSGDTLDSMYKGELNIMDATAKKQIKSRGDRLVALYKAYRAKYFATRVPAGDT